MSSGTRRPAVVRRLAAAVAIVVGLATLAGALAAALSNLLPGVATAAALAVAVRVAWEGALRAGLLRAICFTGAALAVAAAVVALTDGVERRVDLAEVNGRPFLNNVSLGAYADAIRRPRYRRAKLRTLLDSVRAVLGPEGRLPTIRFVDDAGHARSGAAVLLISNNPYAVDRVLGRGTRPRLDSGLLGVVALGSGDGEDRAWTDATFTAAGDDAAEAGLDGNPITLQPPLRFTSRPGRLRVRIAAKHPGVSPSALMPKRLRALVPRLAAIAVGRG